MRRVRALYVALAILFLIAVTYQVRAVIQIFPQWFGVHQVQWPFFLDADDKPEFSLEYVQPNAKKAGVRDGDRLIKLNSRLASSRAVFSDLLLSSRAGDPIDILIHSKGDNKERHIRFSLAESRRDTDFYRAILYVVIPLFSLALGFWVVTARPSDVRAWLLLGVLFSIATFFNAYPDFWSEPLRTPGVIYKDFLNLSWFFCLFLLGIYFPEPFPKASGWRWLRWAVGSYICFWALLSGISTLSALFELHSLEAARTLNYWIIWTRVVFRPLFHLSLLGFIVCIGLKYRLASTIDGKRRLRVLYVGAAISLVPFEGLFLTESLKAVNEQYFSNWLLITIYLLLMLLPVTLAYVVVVQRALDVRMVIRQGLQYTLARRGVLILQIVLSALLFILLAWLMSSRRLNPIETVLLLGIGFWGIFLLHGATQRMAVWIDRRFFRDDYHAERVLSDLAESVRTIVDVRPLLETVAHRITESLHVKQVAVMLYHGGLYQPAHAVGYSVPPDLNLPNNAATIETLKTEARPTRVYFDNPESWVYRKAGMSEEERAQLLLLAPELLLPLLVNDDLLGFMSLGQKLSEAPYSATDLRLLSSVASQTGLALQVARLTAAVSEEVALRERVNRELEIARDVQQHLFPQHFPAVTGLDYAGLCHPAREVGGDYYDFLELPGDQFGVAIGDISGKGIGAALMMASLQASLRGQAAVVPDLGELMRRVNALVHGASSANRYATFFYAQYDPATRLLAYINAGHNPPVILRSSPDGCHVHRLEAGGLPIGLMRQSSYQQADFTLEPGDLLMLFTDGISESMNGDDEEWGEERLIAFTQGCPTLPPGDVAARIMDAAHQFAAGAPQHDDMTVVVLRVN